MSLTDRSTMKLLRHPWIQIACRLGLAAVFIYAAWPKLMDPPGFAKSIHAYKLFPTWSIHPLGLFLPWLELLCAACIALGTFLRAATAWVTALLLAFILALSINLYRGYPVDCGCFNTAGSQKSNAEKLQDMRWTILRDLGLLVLCAVILQGCQSNGKQAESIESKLD